MRTNRRAAAAFGLAASVFFGWAGLVSPASAASPLGTWYTADKDSQVRIANCGGAICGTLVWLKEPNDPATGTAEARQAQCRRLEAKPAADRRGDRARHEAERTECLERQRL